MHCGANYACVLRDNELFLQTEHKVLQGYSGDSLIRCMKMYFNGKIQLYYLTKAFKPLSSIMGNINSDSLLLIIINLLHGIAEVSNHGFLSVRNLDISFNKIYVNPSSNKVGLIYFPLSIHCFDDEEEFDNTIRSELVNLIESNRFLKNDKTYQLIVDLKNTNLSLEDIEKRVEFSINNKSNESFQETPSILREVHTKPTSFNVLKLMAVDAPASLEFKIGEHDFLIGKKDSNDGVILFSKMISRIHCKISCNDGDFYLTDLQSTNGTYINNRRLQPNQASGIKNGDIIRLADVEFRVVLEKEGE